MTGYTTITSKAEGLYKEKGSRFLAFAIPVSGEDEAKEVLVSYRKQFHDARHVCFAYRVVGRQDAGVADSPMTIIERCSDDGEPSGTAGQPILRQLQGQSLSNIVMVVVRYFGGILLGTGGLIVAYKEATLDALSRAEKVEKPILERKMFTLSYAELSAMMKLAHDANAIIVEQGYTETGQATLTLDIPLSQIGKF